MSRGQEGGRRRRKGRRGNVLRYVYVMSGDDFSSPFFPTVESS